MKIISSNFRYGYMGADEMNRKIAFGLTYLLQLQIPLFTSKGLNSLMEGWLWHFTHYIMKNSIEDEGESFMLTNKIFNIKGKKSFSIELKNKSEWKLHDLFNKAGLGYRHPQLGPQYVALLENGQEVTNTKVYRYLVVPTYEQAQLIKRTRLGERSKYCPNWRINTSDSYNIAQFEHVVPGRISHKIYLPPTPKDFIEHCALKEDIDDLFDKKDIVILWGSKKVGKTYIANAYVADSDYNVGWMPANDSLLLTEALINFIQENVLTEQGDITNNFKDSLKQDEFINNLKKVLPKIHTKVFFVFDEVISDNDTFPIVKAVCEMASEKIKVLITTRGMDECKKQLKLENIGGLEISSFADKKLEKLKSSLDNNLITQLQDHDEILFVASSYMQCNKIDCHEYISLLQENYTYKEVIQQSINRIKELDVVCAKDILEIIGYIHNENIPYNLFSYYLGSKTSFPISKVSNVMDFLEDYSIVMSLGNPIEEDPYCDIYGVVQDVIRDNNKDGIKSAFKALLSYPSVINYNPNYKESIVPFESMLSHCMSVIDHSKVNDDMSDMERIDRIQLTLIIARYFIETKRDLERTGYYLSLSEKWTESFDHPYKARTIFLRGIWWRKNEKFSEEERFSKAIQSFEDAHRFFSQYNKPEEYLNLEHNPTKCNQKYQLAISLEYQAQSYSNLANTIKDQQDKNNKLKEAANLFDNAMSEYKKIYGDDDHFDIARIIREQGLILLRQGQILKCKNEAIEGKALIDQAKGHVEKAIEMQKRVYANRFDSHKTVGATQRDLGEICEELNLVTDAIQAFKTALEVNARAFGKEDNPYSKRIKEKIAELEKRK